MTRVTIVIPTYNRVDLTEQCLDALERTTPRGLYEVVVVDNGSSDGTPGWLRAEEGRGRLRAVLNGENLGFGRACNLGAAAGSGDLVLLLNNDTIPHAGWLEPLVAAVEADAGLGAVGSRLLYPDGTIQHAGIELGEQGLPFHVLRGLSADHPQALVERDVAAVTGACALLPRSAFEALGGFDAAYHHYVEDVDLCLRAWAAGLRVRYRPDSVVTHLESASVTDVARRDEQVRQGWATLKARWDGAFPVQPWRHRPSSRLEDAGAFAVAASGAELLAEPALLRAWTATFAGAADATLVVVADERETERLAALAPDGADLVAWPHGAAVETLADAVDAYFGERAAPPPLARLPRVGRTGLAALRAG